MGITEAKKYLSQLHRRQGKPELWPDFLTGLPDKTTSIRKVNEAYPKLDRYVVSFIRIANIQPYLIKYGSGKHTEIVQWAAAILKTTMDNHKGFVGAFDTHDFVAICRRKDLDAFLSEAERVFGNKVKSFYSENDLRRKSILSFKGDNRQIEVGLMKLLSVSTGTEKNVPPEGLIPHLVKCLNRHEAERPLA